MRWCMYIKARHGQRTRKQEIGQIARLEQIEMRMVRWMVSKDVEEREKWGGGLLWGAASHHLCKWKKRPYNKDTIIIDLTRLCNAASSHLNMKCFY